MSEVDYVDKTVTIEQTLEPDHMQSVFNFLSEKDKARLYGTSKYFNSMQWLDEKAVEKSQEHFVLLMRFQHELNAFQRAIEANDDAARQAHQNEAIVLLFALLREPKEQHTITGEGHRKYKYLPDPDDPMTPTQVDVKAATKKIKGETELLGHIINAIFDDDDLVNEFVDALCTNVTRPVPSPREDCRIFESSLDYLHQKWDGPLLVKHSSGLGELYFRHIKISAAEWVKTWHRGDKTAGRPIFTKEGEGQMWTMNAEMHAQYPVTRWQDIFQMGMLIYSMLYIDYYMPSRTGDYHKFNHDALYLRGKF